MNRLLLMAIAMLAAATPAAAQSETSHVVASARITEQVKAGGKPLAAGTYEVRILVERPEIAPGVPSATQRVVEFYQQGKMVARDVAEVFTADERPLAQGTTGSGPSKAVVQQLVGGEFLRIAISDAGARYLIHLPTANFSEPVPQPQAPSRVEIPPSAAEPPPTKQPQQ
jgi:hypothetical protein